MGKVQQYFDQVAGEWDQLRAQHFGEGVRAAAMTAAALESQMTVLDVGTGTGFMALGVGPQVRTVLGMDISVEMLHEASTNMLNAGLDNVALFRANAQEIPIESDTVDAVFTNMVLHHIPNPGAAIREMGRVLKPGGILVITDVEYHGRGWVRDELQALWEGFHAEDLAQWYEAAGLAEIGVSRTGHACYAQSGSGEKLQMHVILARGRKPIFSHSGNTMMAWGPRLLTPKHPDDLLAIARSKQHPLVWNQVDRHERWDLTIQ